MLAGHFGLAAIMKSRQPQVPLWALMLSTQLLDVLFVALLPFNVESFKAGGYGGATISANYTHSLVGALGISLAALIIAGIFWGRRNGLIIGAMVFSHWLLDLVVHRMDMPILPGNAQNLPYLGLGLWQWPWVSAGIELVLILVGAFLYYHAAMRNAVKTERQEAKAGATAKPYRSQALAASITMLVLLLGTLIGDVLGF